MPFQATPESVQFAEQGMKRIVRQRPIPVEIYDDIRNVLVFMRANELHWIADSFEEACVRGNRSCQYLDIRVGGVDTVRLPSGFSLTKRHCEALIEAISVTLNDQLDTLDTLNLDIPPMNPVRFGLRCN